MAAIARARFVGRRPHRSRQRRLCAARRATPTEEELACPHRTSASARGRTPPPCWQSSSPTWRRGAPCFEHRSPIHEPVRPAEIVNVTELRAAPLVLGGLLLASLALGLWLTVTPLRARSTPRARRAPRRSGFGDGDVRGSVRWQGLTPVLVGGAGGHSPRRDPLGRVARGGPSPTVSGWSPKPRSLSFVASAPSSAGDPRVGDGRRRAPGPVPPPACPRSGAPGHLAPC